MCSPRTQTPGTPAPPPARVPEDAVGLRQARSPRMDPPPRPCRRSPPHLGDRGRPVLPRPLHLVQEAQDALQLGLREQSPVLGGASGRTEFPKLLQVVGGQGAGIVLLRGGATALGLLGSQGLWGGLARAPQGPPGEGRTAGPGLEERTLDAQPLTGHHLWAPLAEARPPPGYSEAPPPCFRKP